VNFQKYRGIFGVFGVFVMQQSQLLVLR